MKITLTLHVEEVRWAREYAPMGRSSVEVVLRGPPLSELRVVVPTSEQPQVGDRFTVTVGEAEDYEIVEEQQ